MNIMNEAKKLKPYLVKTRRDIHSRPELGFEEYGTQAYIIKELKKLGIPYKKMIKTGVVGLIKGKKPGKTILLRADIDALPILEENTCSYRSKNKGVMHACGHDTHTAMVLGAARILSAKKNEMAGNIKLVFQPREEFVDSEFDPAEEMVRLGVMNNPKVDMCAALHADHSIPAGKVKVVHGPVMANADKFRIRILGVGAHGSEPQNSRDAVYASACVIQALQSVVSRNVGPLNPAVVSVTMVHSGTAMNVIPPEVTLGGTIRTLNDKVYKLVKDSMRRVVEKTCESLGLKGEIDFIKCYPAFANDERAVMLFERSAAKLIGERNLVKNAVSSMAGENFAYFARKAPSVFCWLGVSKGKGQYPIHHPRFDIDENALVTGAAVLAGFAADNTGIS